VILRTLFDFDFWEVVVVNTHRHKKVISDAHIELIDKIEEVICVTRIGSYGMELVVVYDSEDREDLMEEIDRLIFA